MAKKLYRVVDGFGVPIKTGSPKTLAIYEWQHIAQGVATARNNVRTGPWLGLTFRVQETEVEWKDSK